MMREDQVIEPAKTFWLSNQILKWMSWGEAWSSEQTAEWRRANEMLAHAEQVSNNTLDSFYVADIITTLKRAVNHRLFYLKDFYRLNQLPVKDKPRHPLELLAYLGIIKPRMLKGLIGVRNAIEHENADPPTQERCLEFIEIVWYFLRSTDRLCYRTLQYFHLDGPDEKIGLLIKTGSSLDWKVNISGEVESQMLAENIRSGWLEIKCDYIIQRETDITGFEGTLSDSEDGLRQVLEVYFSAL